jgi:hypothetical protein
MGLWRCAGQIGRRGLPTGPQVQQSLLKRSRGELRARGIRGLPGGLVVGRICHLEGLGSAETRSIRSEIDAEV